MDIAFVSINYLAEILPTKTWHNWYVLWNDTKILQEQEWHKSKRRSKNPIFARSYVTLNKDFLHGIEIIQVL